MISEFSAALQNAETLKVRIGQGEIGEMMARLGRITANEVATRERMKLSIPFFDKMDIPPTPQPGPYWHPAEKAFRYLTDKEPVGSSYSSTKHPDDVPTAKEQQLDAVLKFGVDQKNGPPKAISQEPVSSSIPSTQTPDDLPTAKEQQLDAVLKFGVDQKNGPPKAISQEPVSSSIPSTQTPDDLPTAKEQQLDAVLKFGVDQKNGPPKAISQEPVSSSIPSTQTPDDLPTAKEQQLDAVLKFGVDQKNGPPKAISQEPVSSSIPSTQTPDDLPTAKEQQLDAVLKFGVDQKNGPPKAISQEPVSSSIPSTQTPDDLPTAKDTSRVNGVRASFEDNLADEESDTISTDISFPEILAYRSPANASSDEEHRSPVTPDPNSMDEEEPTEEPKLKSEPCSETLIDFFGRPGLARDLMSRLQRLD
ncbi:unnamed protein product, partial [Mesorhabditis spiculigera]